MTRITLSLFLASVAGPVLALQVWTSEGRISGSTATTSSFAVALEFVAVQSPSFNNTYNWFATTPPGVVAIGEPNQSFRLFVDTGSNMPWVYSSQCANVQVCNHDRRYNHAESSTYVPIGDSVSASYGAGSISGFSSGDVWNISVIKGSSFSWVYLKEFVFAEITTSNFEEQFSNNLWDGFLAMTYPKQRELSSFFTDLVAMGFIEPFAAIDARGSGFSGELQLGSVETGINWNPLEPSPNMGLYWWLVRVDDILVAGKSTGACRSGCTAMFDSGAGPLWMQDSLRDSLHLHDFYPCSQVASLPSITLVIGGVDYTLQGSDYVLPGPGSLCYNQVNQQPLSETSRKHMPSRGVGDELLVHLGAPWFRRFYTALDASNNRVGFK